MITHVRTVHGCLSYSLSIIFFVMQPMIQKYAFSNLMGVGGWWCVCVCGRACGVGVGGGGGGVMGRWPPAGGGVGVVQGIRL